MEFRTTAVVIASGVVATVLTAFVFEALTDRNWTITDWEWPEITTLSILATLGVLWVVSLVWQLGKNPFEFRTTLSPSTRPRNRSTIRSRFAPAGIKTSPSTSRALAGKRIVFVLPWAELAGAEHQALYFAEHLRALGAAVEVCCLTDHDGPGIDAFGRAGISWRVARVDWSGSRAKKARAPVNLTKSLRSMRPDALVPYCTPANVLCGLVWRWTRATTCVWHQQDVLSSLFGDRLVRTALRRTPIVVSNADHALVWLRERGAPSERTRVIPPYAGFQVAVDDRDT